MTSSRQQRRQLERRRAREEARRAAERAAKRRRRARILIPLALVLIVGAIVFFMTKDDDDTENVATEDDGAKPCVKVADPLPTGAPEVPVKEGPPPKELVKEDLKVGDGPEVKPGDKVNAHYIGVACTTGKIFDSSWSRGQAPSEFSLRQVVPGWQEGIPGMKVGGRRLLGIPPDMAYGEKGEPAAGIGPNEALWFVVDMVGTSAGDAPTPAPSG